MDGEGSSRTKGGLYPPPFLGPASHPDIQFYQERRLMRGDSPMKTKKTLAEKMLRTLDKITTATTSPPRHGGERRRPHPSHHANHYQQQQTGGYPGYYPGYRTVRGPHGVSYQYVYNTSPGFEYGMPGNFYEYGVPGQHHSEYQASPYLGHGYCCCEHSGKNSVASKGGLRGICRKCGQTQIGSQRPSGAAVKQRPRLHQLSEHGGGESQNMVRASRGGLGMQKSDSRASPSPSGPRDPYDYIRRTRLRAEEWDNYWETGELPDSGGSEKNHNKQKNSQNQNENDGRYSKYEKWPKDEQVTSTRHSLQNEKLTGQETTGQKFRVKRAESSVQTLITSNLMEDEENSQPESKPLIPSPGSRVPSRIENGGQKEQATSPQSSPTTSPKIKGGENKTKSHYPILKVEEGEDKTPDSGDAALSAALMADIVTMKSKISVAEMRYRKFQRRNPLRKMSLQIEDVIVEEDEEALAREDMDDAHPIIRENEKLEDSTSSDDELGIGKFNQVIGSSNLAEEILSEIYGTTLSTSGEEASETDIRSCSRSMADEILQELYGETGPRKKQADFNDTRETELTEEVSGVQQMEDVEKNLEKDLTLMLDSSSRPRLYRSLSLQEKGQSTPLGQTRLSHLLLDTTRFKLSHRPSLLALLGEEPQLNMPVMPGTPTLHHPGLGPLQDKKTFLQGFNLQELNRINNVIKRGGLNLTDNVGEYSDSEFSDNEFDPTETDDENIPLERPAPEGAEAESQYDVPVKTEPFERLVTGSCDKTCADLDTSYDSGRIADISIDSLMLPQLDEASFDKDSINSFDSQSTTAGGLISISSQSITGGSVIQSQGEKTIIFSPALVSQHGQDNAEKEENNISISSASWINVDGESKEVTHNVSIVSDENGNCSEISLTVAEPVKPPRLKKLARQQSKQEMLRAKGFGVSSVGMEEGILTPKSIKGIKGQGRSRPEISSPILINSTLNPVDLESHKCITLQSSSVPFHLHGRSEERSDTCSVYQAPSSDTDSNCYMMDAAIDEAYNNANNAADIYSEHIYEEIPENMHRVRPLPPIPEGALAKSIFTGATKYEILHYLNDARQRMEGDAVDFDVEEGEVGDSNNFLGHRNNKHRVSSISHVSDSSGSSTDSTSSDGGNVLYRSSGPLEKFLHLSQQLERNDSGVGSDSGLSGDKSGPPGVVTSSCEDCDVILPEDGPGSSGGLLVCGKCSKRRVERKEIIMEIVETEGRYGRDLHIIVEEFYRPMLVAGLLSSDQLASIFLNVEQLIQVNTSFISRLKSEMDHAEEAEDNDLCSVNIGSLFLASMPMLQAFEAYCTKQAASSMLLATMEREKELLRVFLKVSQMENKILRRMNLSSFLMVPVQRVTKYPLLLARLLKVSPANHPDREDIREAQKRIETALEQINKDAKEIIAMKGSWRQWAPGGQGVTKPKGAGALQREMNNIRVRKLSLELLGWEREETKFALEGRLTFAHITDSSNWRQKWGGSAKGSVTSSPGAMKLVTAHGLLLVTLRAGTGVDLPQAPANNPSPAMQSSHNIIFPKLESVSAAVLLLVREKTSRFTTVRDPFFLDKSLVCCEQDWDSEYFEIQEFGNKDSFVFKADDPSMTKPWFHALQFYSQSLGGWRRRRKGLANIMVDPALS